MGLFKSKKEKHALVLMPTPKGAHILVCKKGQSVADRIRYHEEIPGNAVEESVKSFTKTCSSFHLLLGYSEYQLTLLEDKGVIEPELSKIIPWECADSIPYLPEEGEFFYLQSNREHMLYVFSFHVEKILTHLGIFNMGLDWFDTVNTLDPAWASYLVSQEKREQVLFIDSTVSFSRVLYVESARLESIHKFDPVRSELDAMRLGQYCIDNFPEIMESKVPIMTLGLSKAHLEIFRKTTNQTCLELAKPKFSPRDLACLGVGVMYV